LKMKYVKVYVEAGTRNIRHVAVKDSPFADGEGVSGDTVDLDEYSMELIGEPDIVEASELLECIDCERGGRFRLKQDAAEAGMKNVKSRSCQPTLEQVSEPRRLKRSV
jgi:hypothetical protein